MATRGRLSGPPHLISLVKHLPSANAFQFNAGESTCPLPMLPHSMPTIPRTSETSFVNHISQRHICLLETTAACDVYTIWRCKHLRNSCGFCNFTIPPASTLDTQTWPIRMEKVNLLAHWVQPPAFAKLSRACLWFELSAVGSQMRHLGLGNHTHQALAGKLCGDPVW